MFENWQHKKLEKRRRKALSSIRGELLAFEVMIQRAQIAGDTPNDTFVSAVRTRIKKIELIATEEVNIAELTNLIDDAEQQGQLRAYICPLAEIRDEGILSLDRIEEWNVPAGTMTKLRNSLGKKLELATTNPDDARSALRAIYDEYDSWASYTDDYDEKMERFTRWLFGGTLVLLLAAFIAFHFPVIFPSGLLFAGAAGSCVSVMTKMPVFEVGPSGELEAYQRQILGRIGSGVIASLIGC